MHKYILATAPRTGAISQASHLVLEKYFPNKSIKALRKDSKAYQLNGLDRAGNPIQSIPLNYRTIAEFIRENGYFDLTPFNFPEIKCFWLDMTLDVKINWHMHDHSAPDGLIIKDGVTEQIYGPNYPITSKLVREGHSYTTLQPQLLNRIIASRSLLIAKSESALEDDWFFDLRTLISDALSLIEITLNQIYIKAEYDPLPGWRFDRALLGERHGRRFEDKLGWIFKISGNHLDAEKFLPSVNNLRELRNHMMHFDPPSLVITIEEATIWLNQIIDVGQLLIRMREAVNAEVSLQLINFILQKEAIFNPEPHFSNRLPIGVGGADYQSSIWPKK